MFRIETVPLSRTAYAFNPTTWRATSYGFEVDAVWFRRKHGRVTAVMGTYHPMVERRDQQPTASTYEAWIAAADDNRYGGAHLASWDGEMLTTEPRLAPPVAATRIGFLAQVLAGYPDPPAGYDGWWVFSQKGRTR